MINVIMGRLVTGGESNFLRRAYDQKFHIISSEYVMAKIGK